MNNRLGFQLTIVLLLIATLFRASRLPTNPPGINSAEAVDTQIVEFARFGQIAVIYDLGTEGREGMYHLAVSALTAFVGDHPFGYRLLSLYASLLTLACLYAFTRRLFGVPLALFSTAWLAFLLWHMVVARLISRDTLLPLLSIATLLSLSRTVPIYKHARIFSNSIPFGVLGLLLGISFYIHPAQIFMLFGIVSFMLYMLLTRQPMSRRTLGYFSFTLVIATVIAIPYITSSVRRVDINMVARINNKLAEVQNEGWVSTIGDNLVGFIWRGDADLAHNLPNQPLMDPLSAILLMIGIGYAVRKYHQPRYMVMLIMGAWQLPILVGIPNSPNFLGNLAFLPLMAIFVGLGMKQFYKVTPTPYLPRFWWAVSLVLAVVILWGTTSMSRWLDDERLSSYYHARELELAQHLDATDSNVNTVMCVNQLAENPYWLDNLNTSVTRITLMMDSPSPRIRYADCQQAMIFTDGGNRQQVILSNPNRSAIHPAFQAWLAQGEALRDDVIIMDIPTRIEDQVGRLITTAPSGYAPESPGGVEAVQLPTSFGSNLTFLGYIKEPQETYAPGETVTLTTFWRVDSDILSKDLTLFAHMLFDAETVISNQDIFSVSAVPLENRDIIMQLFFLPIPKGLPNGRYQTSIGAYINGSGERIPVLRDGVEWGTRIFLHEVVVDSAKES